MVTNSSLIKGGVRKKIAKSLVKVEGDMIIRAFEKRAKLESGDSLSFCSLFVGEPEILHYTGSSLENDVFPVLAEKGFLFSYLSSEGEIHIHSKEDISLVRI